jgi:hypothetical protein
MLASMLVFLAVVLVATPVLGNYGLWLALHLWLLARGGIYWLALERRKPVLFAA